MLSSKASYRVTLLHRGLASCLRVPSGRAKDWTQGPKTLTRSLYCVLLLPILYMPFGGQYSPYIRVLWALKGLRVGGWFHGENQTPHPGTVNTPCWAWQKQIDRTSWASLGRTCLVLWCCSCLLFLSCLAITRPVWDRLTFTIHVST